jgi:hypothetical protein
VGISANGLNVVSEPGSDLLAHIVDFIDDRVRLHR